VKSILFALSFAYILPIFGQQTVNVKCYRVSDGDSFGVMLADTFTAIRLAWIDCPETKNNYVTATQPFSKEAGEMLRSIINKPASPELEIELLYLDQYGRWVSRVRVLGADVGLAMIEAGAAYSIGGALQSKGLNKLYDAAEKEARKAERGVFQPSLYINENGKKVKRYLPATWRKKNKPKK
jgi:endonuclease YncB( thermonuclease family)